MRLRAAADSSSRPHPAALRHQKRRCSNNVAAATNATFAGNAAAAGNSAAAKTSLQQGAQLQPQHCNFWIALQPAALRMCSAGFRVLEFVLLSLPQSDLASAPSHVPRSPPLHTLMRKDCISFSTRSKHTWYASSWSSCKGPAFVGGSSQRHQLNCNCILGSQPFQIGNCALAAGKPVYRCSILLHSHSP